MPRVELLIVTQFVTCVCILRALMSPSASVDRYPLRSRSNSTSNTNSHTNRQPSSAAAVTGTDTDTHHDKPDRFLSRHSATHLFKRHTVRDSKVMKEKYEAKHRAQYLPDEKADREFPVRPKGSATLSDTYSTFPSFVHYEEPFTVELHQYQDPSKVSTGIHSFRISLKLFLQYLSSIWQLYLLQLDRWPVVTKSVTAAVIGVVADILAQTITYAQQPNEKCITWLECMDLLSLLNQFFIRLLFSPPQHYWYEFLGRLFRRYELPEPSKGHESAINFEWTQSTETRAVSARRQPMCVVVAKMILDQLTFGPLSNLLYFYALGFMEGRSLAFIQSRIAENYVNLMIANYKVWPAIILFNFRYVPPQLQVLFGNIVAIFWNTYVVLTTRM